MRSSLHLLAFTTWLTLTGIPSTQAANVGVLLQAARDVNAPGGLPLRKALDIPFRDPDVTLGGDGCYYLVGTTDPAPGYTTIGSSDPASQMWTVNDGIRMWKSTDLVHWSDLGLIWSIDNDAVGTWVHWWPAGQANPGRAIWAPEIHYINGTYWIPYCTRLAGNDLHLACGLLRSTTGKPEGPYREIQPGAPLGFDDDASMFQDDDGTVYYLFDGYRMARMKADLSGLAESPRDVAFPQPPGWGEGIFLVKVGGKYIFLNAGTASIDPAGNGAGNANTTYDCFSAVSTGSIYGPYTARRRAIPHAGHNNLFQDKSGNWWSTYFGSDPFAPFAIGASGRACIMPITFDGAGQLNFDRGYPRPAWQYTTSKPTGSWIAPTYNDTGWLNGPGAFGDYAIADHGQVTDVGTAWTSGDIWMRKTFTVDSSRRPSLYVRHDGPIEVYINGNCVYVDDSVHPPLVVGGSAPTLMAGVDDYGIFAVPDDDLIRTGVNTIAVHCAAAVGRPAYVDIGVVDQGDAAVTNSPGTH